MVVYRIRCITPAPHLVPLSDPTILPLHVPMARILVAGATGHLGQHIVAELKRQNHWVRALTRNPIRPFEIADEVAGGDLNRIASLHAACGDIDIVISAVNLFKKK